VIEPISCDLAIAHLQERITDSDNEVYVSAASFWEVAIQAGIGKLNINVAVLRQAARESGYLELPVRVVHTEKLVQLPAIHKDPFDRILVAQANAEPMRMLTSDRLLAPYGSNVKVI
jgi:PIN domain nuclease of toxin-antitoxin system